MFNVDAQTREMRHELANLADLDSALQMGPSGVYAITTEGNVRDKAPAD
jgi:hypothetical protein